MRMFPAKLQNLHEVAKFQAVAQPVQPCLNRVNLLILHTTFCFLTFAAFFIVYALVDCNNFFVSCERIRHPELQRHPVVVLSNNDGCIVAMSNEVKALGISRGTPFFKVRYLMERHGVAVFSGSHSFYKACSERVMHALRELDEMLEIYSVDEAFINIPSGTGDLSGYGRYIVEKVWNEARIPVSVGISHTKTLAKIAARFAKKYPGYRGACLIDTEDRRVKALGLTAIEDVWGIGRRLSRTMRLSGINTALDFASLSREKVRTLLNISGERTWRELHGEACVPVDSAGHGNKSMLCSRTFARDLHSFQEVHQAVMTFAETIGVKLRSQGVYAKDVEVFLATNRYHASDTQYRNSCVVPLPDPSNYTPAIACAADTALRKIYRAGYGYKRAGVAVRNILPAAAVQPGLFDDTDTIEKRGSLMRVTDAINASIPRQNAVRPASMGDGLADLVKSSYHESGDVADLTSSGGFRTQR